jgi:uncharacterized membrane protein YphA (DoxX/SURF4 family)
MKRNLLVEVIATSFILLFVYIATSKFYGFTSFRRVLSSAPYISSYAAILAWAVPVTLLLAALLLIIPAWRQQGLWASFILMVLFTGYISFMLSFAHSLPCSCGGVWKEMTWKQQLIFNLGFTMLALTGIWLNRKKRTSPEKQLTHAMA